MMQRLFQFPRHIFYLVFISLVGVGLLSWAVSQFFTFQEKLGFLLFVLLGSLAQIAATTATIKSKTAVTYAISPAVSLATVPFYGPAAAILVETITSISLWLIKPADAVIWKKSLPQLAFNSAMSQISIFVGSCIYLLTADQFGPILPWLFAAVVNDQLNLLLLTVMIRLQYGKEFRIFTIWKENAWAIPIGILISSVGGGFLAFSFQHLGLIGISIFFLPLLLSAYAFRLYVSQMQAHMDNLEEIVAERTETLKKLMKEKDAFLAVLTHDMKSPITTIHLYANMIKEHPQILEKRPHMIDRVLYSQEALADIVDNILDLEKLQADGQVPMYKETFEYIPVAQKVIDMLQIQAEAKKIELALSGFDNPVFVHADRRHMERILNNLISNAIKYTPAKGKVVVSLNVQPQTNVLHLQVQDTGYGIPAEELMNVFERFHRVSSHKKLAAGTGLGLTITKALVEAHGGRVEVSSELEKGSVFTARLPILHAHQPDKHDEAGQGKHHLKRGRAIIDKMATTFFSY